MKTIINLLIIPFLLLTLSSANAQTVWSRISKQYDVTLPTYNTNKVYTTTGVGTNASTTTADCIALQFRIRGTDLVTIKNSDAIFPLFQILHKHKSNGSDSKYNLFIKYENNKFNFIIERNNDFLINRKLSYAFTYIIGDELIPSTRTTTQYLGLLLSDYGAILWQDDSSTSSSIRTAPLFFGYPSNRYAGTSSTKYGIIDYLRYNTSTTYDLKITNYRVDNFILRKPSANYKTLSQMILKNTDNPILNQRLSGESLSSEETLSIDDSALFSSNIKLHPNPSNGQFNIDLPMTEPGNVSFEIFNMNGQKVFEQKQVEFFQGSTTHYLDTQNKLTSGVYFLNVTAPNFSQKTKLIIK
jgi:hypothetical protein